MMTRKIVSEMSLLPEKSDQITTVHKTIEVSSRRKKSLLSRTMAVGRSRVTLPAKLSGAMTIANFRLRISDAAKPAMPPGVFLQGVEELLPAEFRPEGRCHHKFRVGNLPQQKIADPHLPARPDEQIRLGIMPRIKVFGD